MGYLIFFILFFIFFPIFTLLPMENKKPILFKEFFSVLRSEIRSSIESNHPIKYQQQSDIPFLLVYPKHYTISIENGLISKLQENRYLNQQVPSFFFSRCLNFFDLLVDKNKRPKIKDFIIFFNESVFDKCIFEECQKGKFCQTRSYWLDFEVELITKNNEDNEIWRDIQSAHNNKITFSEESWENLKQFFTLGLAIHDELKVISFEDIIDKENKPEIIKQEKIGNLVNYMNDRLLFLLLFIKLKDIEERRKDDIKTFLFIDYGYKKYLIDKEKAHLLKKINEFRAIKESLYSKKLLTASQIDTILTVENFNLLIENICALFGGIIDEIIEREDCYLY